MKTALYTQISVMLLLLLLPFLSMAHDSCLYCHSNATPTEGNAGLLSPLPGLCINCHPDRVGNGEHVIDVKQVAAMTMALPLLNGRLTCTTCHDPHVGSPTLLRIEEGSLCLVCHYK